LGHGRLRRNHGEPTAAEALAWLRIGGAVVVTLAVARVAVATSFQRRTRQIEELGAGQAALLHEALDAEERERARIGERLHDDTLQSLLAAQQDVREARAGYLPALEFADEALTDSVRALRETVLGLHPASLHERGLELALRVEVDRVARRAKVAAIAEGGLGSCVPWRDVSHKTPGPDCNGDRGKAGTQMLHANTIASR
jgi:signal transduction histidine kinase